MNPPILILALSLFAADSIVIDELGVITPTYGIHLEKATARTDWSHFVVEFLPRSAPTNLVTLIVTNDFLWPSNIMKLPLGRVLMGVRNASASYTSTNMAVYSFTLDSLEFPKPKASKTQILSGPDTTNSGLAGVDLSRMPTNAPPVPWQAMRQPKPLENDTNVTFGHQMKAFYEETSNPRHRVPNRP